jgi:acetyl/propionyl-CoA carboxylase alpha subunit
LRVCAEDPQNNFLPDIGTLKKYEIPKGEGIRVDDGYEQGMEIPIYYDPMIAKLIAHAPTRNEAIEKLTKAINDFRIVGLETTLSFGKWAIHQPAFVEGKFDTHFVAKYFSPEKLITQNSLEAKAAAAVAIKALLMEQLWLLGSFV